MSDARQANEADNTPGLFHRLVDWSIYPASVAAACTVGFSLLFAAVAGRRTNADVLEAAVAAVSALIAAGVTALTKREK